MRPSTVKSTLDRNAASELIQVCIKGQKVFERSASSIRYSILSAELVQYSAQRREFAQELSEAMGLSDQAADADLEKAEIDPIDGEPTPLADALFGSPMLGGDRGALLAECERSDATAIDAYRRALATGLSPSISGIVNSQFFAITRVQSRLQSLLNRINANDALESTVLTSKGNL